METPYRRAVEAPIRLLYRPDDSDMSDVEEALAQKERIEPGQVCIGELLGNPHRKGMGKVKKEVAGNVYLSARRLFGDGLVVGGDDLDEAQRANRCREPLFLRDETSEMSMEGESGDDNGTSYVKGSRFGAYLSMCGPCKEAM